MPTDGSIKTLLPSPTPECPTARQLTLLFRSSLHGTKKAWDRPIKGSERETDPNYTG